MGVAEITSMLWFYGDNGDNPVPGVYHKIANYIGDGFFFFSP